MFEEAAQTTPRRQSTAKLRTWTRSSPSADQLSPPSVLPQTPCPQDPARTRDPSAGSTTNTRRSGAGGVRGSNDRPDGAARRSLDHKPLCHA